MTYTIILVVLAGAVFLSRKLWVQWIKSLFEKEKPTQTIDMRPFQLPQGLVRNFIIAIEIEEKGDGTAKFEVKKIIK